VWIFLLTLALLVFQAVPALAESGIRVFVDGTEVQTDVAPFIHEGRTLVPLRALGEALGFAVDYDDAERRITLVRGETTLVLWVDSTRVLVNGREATIDVPALVRDGRTFVPVRFVAEQLGAEVEWDGVQVKVTRPQADVAVPAEPAEPVAEEPAAEPAQPAMDPEARALLEKIQAAGQENPDGKLSGWMEMDVAISGAIGEQATTVYGEFSGHIYQGEMLVAMTATMTVPEIGEQTLEFLMAGRDGTLYLYDAQTGTWTESGPYDPGDLSQVSQIPGMELPDLKALQEELLAGATATIVGTEEVDGVRTTRLDVQLSPEAVNRLVGKLVQVELAELATEVTFDRYSFSLWADADGQVRKMTLVMDLKMVIEDPVAGPITITQSAQSEFRFVPVSEPIDWPESLEAYLQSQGEAGAGEATGDTEGDAAGENS